MNRFHLGHTLGTTGLGLGLLLLRLRLLLGRLQQPRLRGAGLAERTCYLLKDLRMLQKLCESHLVKLGWWLGLMKH